MTIFQEDKYVNENDNIDINNDIPEEEFIPNLNNNINNNFNFNNNLDDDLPEITVVPNLFKNEMPKGIYNNINFYKNSNRLSNKEIINYLNIYIKFFVYYKYIIFIYHTYLLLTDSFNLDLLLFKIIYYLININNIYFYYNNMINIDKKKIYNFPKLEILLYIQHFITFIAFEQLLIMVLYNTHNIFYCGFQFIFGNLIYFSIVHGFFHII